MCGIAGLIGARTEDLQTSINNMINCMLYRGPDDSGSKIFETPNVALGHLRLSIIDLSDMGAQPMATTDERYWIVFNGEIYNYLELRDELRALGIEFRSNSDTEVLLNAYVYWGVSCLERLNGMFAFAIWDKVEHMLFAARDRLGEKPFYYKQSKNGDEFLFASEIKSILTVDNAYREEDATLVDPFMTFGYVPGEETMCKGIKRLLPGHYLIFREKTLILKQYWDLCFSEQNTSTEEEHLKNLRNILEKSVDLRLRSDVPLGVFLSGGLDSSSIVAMLAPNVSSGLKTFSVAYDFGPQYNETPYARQVSTQYQTDHYELLISPQKFLDFIPNYVRYMDEPVTEAAAISLYYISKLAREHVIVCLSGEGADELFAGYDFYRYNLILEKIHTILNNYLANKMASTLKRIGRYQKLVKYLNMATLSLEDRYHGISSYDMNVKAGLYTVDFMKSALDGNEHINSFLESLFSRSRSWNPLNRMLYFDTKTWLVDDLLIKADRMSMANSVELRVPFLDHRVVEYAASMPTSYKMTLKNKKIALKKLMQKRLPSSIISRKKMGFPTPLVLMFKKELYNYAADQLLRNGSKLNQYFKAPEIARLLNDHKTGKADNHRILWQLIVLDEWMSQNSAKRNN